MSFRVPDTPASSSTSGSAFIYTGRTTRKRVNSTTEEPTTPSDRKRPRVSEGLASTSTDYFGGQSSFYELRSLSYSSYSVATDIFDAPRFPLRRPRMLSASSSMSSLHQASPPLPMTPDDFVSRPGMLTRTASKSSLRDISTKSYAETSAYYHLRSGRTTIDFSPADVSPTTSVSPPNGTGAAVDTLTSPAAGEGMWPVGWAACNVLLFGRGNRVHYKSLSAPGGDEIGQLCKIRDSHGRLRLVECGNADQPNIVALCTTKGYVQLWDVVSKKMLRTWTSKGPTAMKWSGPVLTIGGEKGAIRHYDTRIKETDKMKEQTKKVTRHQTKICSLAWHDEGKLFASGDESGTVLVWDTRQKAPLDVGEMVQRRKKMQHEGKVTALAWCTWQSKILASGDSVADGSGTIRIWNVNTSTAFLPSSYPDRLALDAQITSLHFSPHCKELLSTHGPGKCAPPPPFTENHLELDLANRAGPYVHDPVPSRIANSVVVHSYPSLKQVAMLSAAQSNVAGSILSPNGQKIVLAVPGEGKLKVWDVWGKRKELRRTSSSLTCSIR